MSETRHARTIHLWAALAVLVLGCGSPSGAARAQELVILYTNDIHAAIEPVEEKDGPPAGGILALDAMVRKIRAEGKSILLVDAGDVLSGHPVSAFEHEGVPGGALFRMMQLVGYDAMTLGNHDFDNGQEALAGLVKIGGFRALCANVTRGDSGAICEGVKPYDVVEVGGLRVGLVGIALEDLAETTARRNTAGLTVHPRIEIARRIVAELDPRTDLIVVLAHEDLAEDLALAEAVPGIDVIVGGHDHSAFDQPRVAGGTLVVKSGCKLRRLGRLDLVVKDDAVASHTNRLLELPHDPDAAGPELRTLVERLLAEIDEKYQVPIGELKDAWRRNYYDESNLGDWVAAAYARASGADIGFVNSGSLRKDMEPGTITVGDVMEIAPFHNTLCAFTVTGRELLEICRHNAWAAATQDHGILQVAGVTYAWRQPPSGEVEVVQAAVNGKPVDPAADYRCAASDFIVFDQAEKYLGFVPARREKLFLVTYEVLIEAVRSQREIAIALDQRIQRRGP